MDKSHISDYTKCLKELAKYEVRPGANDKRWGIWIRGTNTRVATFMAGARGLHRALAQFFEQRYQQERAKGRRNDKASAGEAGRDVQSIGA